jgi:uncharacterized sulfatase
MMRRAARRLLVAALAASLSLTALAADFDYALKPVKIAPDTWMIEGSTQDFSFENGGNIVNTAFVVTADGVLVIDTGPSRLYGEQMRAAIAKITDKPIVTVLNTHHHPDHFLGNQAFERERIRALPQTTALIKEEGGAFNENMYRLAGDAMAGTEVTPPGGAIGAGTLRLGEHEFEIMAMKGHTPADLAVFDKTTGVLFAADLLFHDRAPTTPHATLADWNAALDRLAKIPAKVIVPGHGPASTDDAPIRQTRAWLHWLEQTLRAAAADGEDMNEVLATPIPEALQRLSLASSEFRRSISHLYPGIELDVLQHRH